MEVIVHTVSTRNDKLTKTKVGRIFVVDNKVTAEPDWIMELLTDLRGVDLTQGEKSLPEIPRALSNGYLSADLIDSSGGANPGGAERT